MAAASPFDVNFERYRLIHILETLGERVLTFILKKGTRAPNTPISLLDYLDALPHDSTAHYRRLSNMQRRYQFTRTEKKQIAFNFFWNMFDITLLFKVIRLACENIAHPDDPRWMDINSLEGLIKKIKDERNMIFRERPVKSHVIFHAKVSKLKDLFMKALEAAQTRYNISDQEINDEKRSIEEGVQHILVHFTRQKKLHKDNIKMLQVFKDMLIRCLRNTHKKSQTFDPLCFLSGSTPVHIQDIFTKIFMEGKEKDIEIPCFKIVGSAQSLGQPPQLTQPIQPPQLMHSIYAQLMLLKGVAGSGKTTLLTYILSEWLRDECDRRIKHLDEYDFVLHILCRDETCTSLQDFLEQVLPEAVRFRPHTIALLKKCNVLFLIDDVDERNSSSRQLVKDILEQGKRVPGVTILCTSRPEAAKEFVQSAPEEYRRDEVELGSINSCERTECVLKYYNSLIGTGSWNPARVRQVVENIVWRDHFGLPQNLLFLATMLHDNSDAIQETTTQTNLYVTTLECCIKKLQDQLASNPESRDIDRESCKESIIRVLEDVICKIALEGLLDDRLHLSDVDITQLRECCGTESLPCEEMLEAFFSMQKYVVNGEVHETYYAPFKGVWELICAKYIVKHLIKGSSRGSIWQLLLDTSQKAIELYKLRNLLLHVAGLLSRPDVPPLPESIQEVVDLLAHSGMENCNDWLHLLQNTEVNSTALNSISKHIGNEDERMYITDTTITSATALLPLIPRKTVCIDLMRREGDMSKLVEAAAKHDLKVLNLWCHYKQPDHTPASDPLLCAASRSHLEMFTGHLSPEGIGLLQECHNLQHLRLAVSGDHDAAQILSAIAAVYPSLPHLSTFKLHVPVSAVTPDTLTTPLPDIPRGYADLVLSDVGEEVLKAHQIAAALQPREKGYWGITFPDRRTEAAAVWRQLIILMGDAGLRVWDSVDVLDTGITEEEEKDLNLLTKNIMPCDFKSMDETWLWL